MVNFSLLARATTSFLSPNGFSFMLCEEQSHLILWVVNEGDSFQLSENGSREQAAPPLLNWGHDTFFVFFVVHLSRRNRNEDPTAHIEWGERSRNLSVNHFKWILVGNSRFGSPILPDLEIAFCLFYQVCVLYSCFYCISLMISCIFNNFSLVWRVFMTSEIGLSFYSLFVCLSTSAKKETEQKLGWISFGYVGGKWLIVCLSFRECRNLIPQRTEQLLLRLGAKKSSVSKKISSQVQWQMDLHKKKTASSMLLKSPIFHCVCWLFEIVWKVMMQNIPLWWL